MPIRRRRKLAIRLFLLHLRHVRRDRNGKHWLRESLALFHDRRGSVFAIIPLPENPLGFSAYDEATRLGISPSRPFVAKLVACHPPAVAIGRGAEKRGQFFGVSRHETVPVEANGHGR